MGVLPGGRGNDFARVAGIPLDVEAACDVIAHGEVRAVDVGDVDGSTFIGIASLGFDSEANRIANEAPAQLGALVYAYGALRALAAWKHAGFEVVVDGEARAFSGWSVACANSKAYGGGMFMAPDADLHDGKLDVVISEATSKAKFLRVLPAVFKGKHVERADGPRAARRRGAHQRRPPVHGLRRRRPDRRRCRARCAPSRTP